MQAQLPGVSHRDFTEVTPKFTCIASEERVSHMLLAL